MKYAYKTVEVEVSMDEFSDSELLDELAARGVVAGDASIQETLSNIYQLRRTNKDYQAELDALIYNVLGKIV